MCKMYFQENVLIPYAICTRSKYMFSIPFAQDLESSTCFRSKMYILFPLSLTLSPLLNVFIMLVPDFSCIVSSMLERLGQVH